MDLFDIIALALIQGITEFLPVSSSGHLVLWPLLTGRPDQGLSMDVAVHMGTLAAVCLYFRRDAGRLVIGLADVVGLADKAGKATREPFLFFVAVILVFLAITWVSGLALRYAEVRVNRGHEA